MATLEMHYYCENFTPTTQGREKTTEAGKKYFLFKLQEKEQTNSFYSSLEEIAKEVANSLFFYSKKGPAYDKIILYRSLDGKLEGKPRLLANRKKVVISGAVSDTDELYELQRRVVEIIDRELAEELSDKF